ncbi:FecR family protein [Mucilaginibacter agri]|uniref:DUF4974 domain-containing protein n=1 Tax=Mucilaginibacter agri TaxID=2695265 RepID=A0A966DTZ9_9SPHI|nr:FecR domain-containing protein [Mucilaginibacter agri]NCD71185.1 DUF4974 domain-containing protein [Mucilaginibacter agri]
MGLNELKLLAQKYLNGTATAEEKQKLDQWYDTVYAGGTEVINTNDNETEADVKQRIFENIHSKMHAGDNAAPPARPKHKMRQLLVTVASAAAVLAIVCYAMLPSVKTMIGDKEKQVINVPSNRVLHITLADGSRVWLNAGSVFKYPKNFEGKTRTVELLEGRAFFDVKHEDKHPFIVKTKSLNITVLGTSFDVNSYGKEGKTCVSVVTGKVGVTMPNNNKPAVMLVAKQQAVLYNMVNSTIVTQPVKEIAINAWCKNNFVFDQESLGNVFKALEKEYNTTITVQDKKLLDERISIKLGNQHLDTIMEILSFTKHFKYQIANDSTVVVK